ncbi:hypothetical protein D9V28_12675 [Mycetocola zhadangensis]|uniref:CshA domain-containing protein n=1 Tax=Mycetocola zhadangensis TaxID=1164595 RepID=A0A3L7IXA3_9MICO|nr:hypothetical protein D9V28_12675 [Mycetocola zhadangensis]
MIAAIVLAILTLPLVAMPAQAQHASQGTGRYNDSVFWFEWEAVPNTGTTQTNTTTILGQPFAVTCSIANMTRERGTGAGDWLAPYRPGVYSGDMLDDLYNRGGTGTSNTMPIGLFTQQANSIEFDFSCSASLEGRPYPLAGLVMADAESTAPNELIAASIAPSGTWRVIDRARSTACESNSILASRTVSDTENRLSLASTGECTAGSPVNVAFMDGVTSATDVTVTGNGREAIALGVVASFEGSDAPASYGSASHGLTTTFTGGEIPEGPAVRTNDAAFELATPLLPTPRLGASVDPDVQPFTSADARADDLDVQVSYGNVNDEDAFAAGTTISVVPGQIHPLSVRCVGTGTVGGWIDWDRNGTFDSDERAQATCAAGAAALSWTVPADVQATPPGAFTFQRLRIASTADAVASPSGAATNGEVEDHTLSVNVPQPAANPDTRTTQFGTPVSVPVLGNDVTGGSPFDPASVRLLDGGTPVTSLVTDEGTFTVNETTGEITFAPAALFAGVTPAVPYRVTDEAGRSVESTLTVTVVAPTPVAVDDATTGAQGAKQTIDPVANDTAGAREVPLDASTLTLLDADGTPQSEIVVAGEGAYELKDGRIVFTPEGEFLGTATGIRYQIADANGTLVTAVYTPTVTVRPIVVVDAILAEAERGDTVSVDPSDSKPDLDPSTVRIIDAAGAQVTRFEVAGEGVWTVDAESGVITFTPASGFDGDPTPIRYTAVTAQGVTVQGTVEIRYSDSPWWGLAATGAALPTWTILVALVLSLAGVSLVARSRRTAVRAPADATRE